MQSASTLQIKHTTTAAAAAATAATTTTTTSSYNSPYNL